MADGDKRKLKARPSATGRALPVGRHLWHDPANREFPVRALLPKRVTPSQARTSPWWRRGVFDQRVSNCTMEAAAGLLVSSPFRLSLPRTNLAAWDTEDERVAGYERSKDYDPWPGRDYDGTSSDAPYKMLRELGHIAEWRWGFGVQDLRDTVAMRSPMGVGTVWLNSMDTPRLRSGYPWLVVDPASGERGGHEWEVVYWDADDDWYLMVQSWGPTWGKNGRAKVAGADMAWLLENGGDCTTVVLPDAA